MAVFSYVCLANTTVALFNSCMEEFGKRSS